MSGDRKIKDVQWAKLKSLLRIHSSFVFSALHSAKLIVKNRLPTTLMNIKVDIETNARGLWGEGYGVGFDNADTATRSEKALLRLVTLLDAATQKPRDNEKSIKRLIRRVVIKAREASAARVINHLGDGQ